MCHFDMATASLRRRICHPPSSRSRDFLKARCAVHKGSLQGSDVFANHMTIGGVGLFRHYCTTLSGTTSQLCGDAFLDAGTPTLPLIAWELRSFHRPWNKRLVRARACVRATKMKDPKTTGTVTPRVCHLLV